jgi:hypothetical protein
VTIVAPRTTQSMRAGLHSLVTDGVLPPWSDWYGPGVMLELGPEEQKFCAAVKLPGIRLAYFKDPIPEPAGRCGMPCGYLLLNAACAADAAEAESRGWPVMEEMGAHSDIVARPKEIAAAIESAARGI